MKQAIAISDLTKRYGTKTALRNVSMQVAPGEIFGFLGPNGAGKTTTIRCVMDFIRPDGGSISIFGKDAQKDSVAIKQLVGYLPADDQLYDKWNARQHIAYYTKLRGRSDPESKLLSRLDLNPSVQVRHLSTGNKQKLGFLLALVGKPKLLILDEPTRGLDPLLQNEMYAILKEYVAAGGTVFISSHNLAEVEHICTNVGVIKDGTIVATESLNDIRAMKLHIVTVTFASAKAAKMFVLPDTQVLHTSRDQITLRIRGGITPLIRELSKRDLVDVEITHAPLEDIFMEYYRS